MRFAFVVGLLTIVQLGFSQRNCNANNVFIRHQQENYEIVNVIEEQKRFEKKWAKENPSSHVLANVNKGNVIQVPVVVHILYNSDDENISDEQIQTQIDVLNEDFSGTNADNVKVPAHFFDVASNAEIEFVLATKNQYGSPTNGITRTFTNETSFSANDTKMYYTIDGGRNSWGPNRYVNIWVCNLVGDDPQYTLFGHATGSWALSSAGLEDGIVINYRFFGRRGSAIAPIDLGRTCTHEMGHYFNLDHIFGNDTGCDDDGVSDTPIPDISNEGCLQYPHNANSSCIGSNEYGEMFMNFLDYVNDSCMHMFTLGQASVMQAALNGPRRGLWDPTYTSVGDVKSNIKFTIYPNLVGDRLSLEYPEELANSTLYITNSFGRRIVDNIKISHNLSVKYLTPGLYTIMVNGSDFVISERFIKMK